MAKYVDAVVCADIISKKLSIPLEDLVDVFAEVPAADVAPSNELAKKFVKKFEKNIKDMQVTLGQTWEIQNALKTTLEEMTEGNNAKVR